jgi:hypothetical protein
VDYLAGSGTLTFPPGVTQAWASVTVLGDAAHEPDEWVILEFRNPTNAVLGPIPLGPTGFRRSPTTTESQGEASGRRVVVVVRSYSGAVESTCAFSSSFGASTALLPVAQGVPG